jgi:dTDP-glucose 4,6-dehydratase
MLLHSQQGVSHVVHFAAESHVDRSITGPQIFVQTNVIGTQVLLDCALKAGVERFHHISTDEVLVHELGTSDKFDEQTKYDPRSRILPVSVVDHLVRAYGETYGLPFLTTVLIISVSFPENFFH